MYKIINDHIAPAQRFLNDLRDKGVIICDISNFSSGVLPAIYPQSYLDKCTHATIALSGCSSDNADYMVICPYRVDRNKGRMVYDIDPTIIAIDQANQSLNSIAVIGYHQDFPNRTTEILHIPYTDINSAVATLKQSIQPSHTPLSAIPREVEESLHHMADYFRIHYGLNASREG